MYFFLILFNFFFKFMTNTKSRSGAKMNTALNSISGVQDASGRQVIGRKKEEGTFTENCRQV